MARRTKRLWTEEEKRAICLQTTAPGVLVTRVAQRYAMNANLIVKWLCELTAKCNYLISFLFHPVSNDHDLAFKDFRRCSIAKAFARR